MRVAVTGGAGFIGSRLVSRLVERGDDVVVIDTAASTASGAETICASVLDSDAMSVALRGVEAVVHLAGLVRGGMRRDPAAGATLQLQGTINILESCRSNGVRNLAYASSFYVYDGLPPEAIVDESTPLDPRHMELFGSAKLMGEVLCRQWAETYGLGVVSLRYGPAYGGRGSSAVDEFVKTGLEGGTVDVWGRGTRHNQYTYVGDLVDGTVASLGHGGHTFNLVSPEAMTMRELAELMAQQYGFRCTFDESRPEGPMLPYIAAESAVTMLGWVPIRVKDGIERMMIEHSERK